MSREGCCADTRKPCPYHQGYQDALDALDPRKPIVERILWNERGHDIDTSGMRASDDLVEAITE